MKPLPKQQLQGVFDAMPGEALVHFAGFESVGSNTPRTRSFLNYSRSFVKASRTFGKILSHPQMEATPLLAVKDGTLKVAHVPLSKEMVDALAAVGMCAAENGLTVGDFERLLWLLRHSSQ